MKTKIVEKVKTAESTISMFFGIAVVVIAGVLLFNYFKNYIKKQPVEETQSTESVFDQAPEEGKPAYNGELPTKYQVQINDSLWSISVKFYGYGYNWVDISKENNLNNSDQIEVGQELTIPNVEPRIPAKAETLQTKTANTIEGSSYVVQKGDSLWNISVRAYQDGYKWVEIAKANNLSNPDFIHAGNTLTIPR